MHSQAPTVCPCPEPDKSNPWSPSHFLSSFPTKTLCNFSLSHTFYIPRPSHSSRFDYLNDVRWAVQIIKLLLMRCYPLPFTSFPFRLKFILQHPIPIHPQLMLSCRCERPCFTPTLNNWQNCSTVCTRIGTLIVATIYLQLIQNRYGLRSFTVLQCIHQHCVQPVASDVEVVGYL